MRAIILFAAAAVVLSGEEPCKPRYPCYSAESIVNAASFRQGITPGSLFTIFGADLVWPEENAGSRTYRAAADRVNVIVGPILAEVFYASPTQINALVPPELAENSSVEVRVVRQGLSGPPVKVALLEHAPALFQYDPETAIALRYPTWQPATPENPARPGEIVSLFATGLGRLKGAAPPLLFPRVAAELLDRRKLRILLNGRAVEDGSIEYAGTAPPFLGLYQINLRLPDDLDPDPEILVVLGTSVSRPGLRLRTSP